MLGEAVSKTLGQVFSGKLFGRSNKSEGPFEVFGVPNGETVNLYRGASQNSPIYVSVTNGEKVYRYDTGIAGNIWARVEYKDVSAWIESRYLRPTR